MRHILASLLLISLYSCGGSSDETPRPTPLECESTVSLTNGDPLAGCAWYLHNTGQNAFAKNGGSDEPNGMYLDMNMLNYGSIYKGQGVKIAISDTGLELTHEDLKANILKNKSKNFQLPAPYIGDPGISSSEGDHGTSVAGIIAARDNNGVGSRGIASRASIAGFNFLNSNQSIAIKISQADGVDFDIFNQSWGLVPDDGNETIEDLYHDQLKYGVTSLRGGKGALYVKAAGNYFEDAVSSNMDPYNTTPYTINVAALDAQGISASYSQAGSSNLISAFGGEYGVNHPAIITTDNTGCSLGYARTQTGANNFFEVGGRYNLDCNYTSIFNGTSAATPMVSGAIAMILSANPNLSWRDVRHILISTARPIHLGLADIFHNISEEYPSSPVGHIWEDKWKMNTANHYFHNWYGFGAIDVDAAISMALSYTEDLGIYTESLKPDGSWAYQSGAINLAIPDDSASGVSSTLTVTESYTIETVQIKVNITHPYSGDIGLELTSPSGTKSIMLNINNHFAGADDITNMILLSNMFYGELTVGSWTLKVIDGHASDTGVLVDWEMKINGGSSTVITF